MPFAPSFPARNWPLALVRGVVAGLFVALLLPLSAQAQELEARRESTEERLQNLKQQIERSESRLQQAAKAEEATQDKLDDLEREIALLVDGFQNKTQIPVDGLTISPTDPADDDPPGIRAHLDL